MKCPYCGFENVGSPAFCISCGHELAVAPVAAVSPSGGTGSRFCVSCGRAIQFDANVCPYCGHDYRYPSYRMRQPETISSGLRVVFYILSFLIPLVGIVLAVVYMTRPDPEPKEVGKICLILAVISIALTVVFAVILYFLVLGFAS